METKDELPYFPTKLPNFNSYGRSPNPDPIPNPYSNAIPIHNPINEVYTDVWSTSIHATILFPDYNFEKFENSVFSIPYLTFSRAAQAWLNTVTTMNYCKLCIKIIFDISQNIKTVWCLILQFWIRILICRVARMICNF